MAAVDPKIKAAVADRLAPFCEDNPALAKLLGWSLGRVLVKAGKQQLDWNALASFEDITHIADWLKAALVNNEDWLKNVDQEGRPAKLLKFGSVEQIKQEADKAMAKAVSRMASVQVVEGDEELIRELSDGYYLVRLLTPAALDRESGRMGHCIGEGAYDDKLEKPGVQLVSLRDPSGKPHVTMEIVGNRVVQVQGKQNRSPIEQYIQQLGPHFVEHRLKSTIPEVRFRHIVDADGVWHSFDNLPDGLRVRSELWLTAIEIDYLPPNMTVHNLLDLHKSTLTSLPANLTVHGFLDASQSGLETIGPGLKVYGKLTLGGTKVCQLPEGTIVTEGLDLPNCFDTSLPASISGHKVITWGRETMTVAEFNVLMRQALVPAGP
jgi:hypothetical protein